MLRTLGVTDPEERLYRALLRHPTAARAELARDSGLERRAADCVLMSLENHGLLRLSPHSTCGYIAIPPDMALSAMVNRRRAELDAANAAAGEYLDEYLLGQRAWLPAGLIHVITGSVAIGERTVEILQTVQRELLCLDTPPYRARNLVDVVDSKLALLANGVVVRTIYDRQAIETPERSGTIFKLVDGGEHARVVESLPSKMLVADRRRALLPLSGHGHPYDSAAEVRTCGMLDALLSLFEVQWAAAIPFSEFDADADDELTAEVKQVVSMLSAGVTDQVIARHLGVSVRTGRRRIHQVLAALHTTTRFQAGVQAVRRGWL